MLTLTGELAHNYWSDDVHVTLARSDPDEAQLLAQFSLNQVMIVFSTKTAVAKLRRQLDDTRISLDAAGTVSTARGAPPAAGTPGPGRSCSLPTPPASSRKT